MDGNRGAKGSIKDRLISMLYRIRYAKKTKKEDEYTIAKKEKQVEYLRKLVELEEKENVDILDSRDKKELDKITINVNYKFNDDGFKINKKGISEEEFKVQKKGLSVVDVELSNIEHKSTDLDVKVDLKEEIKKTKNEVVILEEVETFVKKSKETLNEIDDEVEYLKKLSSEKNQKTDELEERYKKLREKVDKLKAQFDAVKDKYDLSEFAILESIKLIDNIKDYKSRASLNEMDMMIKVCKKEMTKIKSVTIEYEKTEKVGTNIDEIKHEQKIVKIKFNKSKENINKIENTEEELNKKIKSQEEIIEDLYKEASYFERVSRKEVESIGFGKMISALFNIAGGILTLPFSGSSIFGVALGNTMINRGLKKLNSSLEGNVKIVYEFRYNDIAHKIAEVKDRVEYTNLIISDNLNEIKKLKENFKKYKEFDKVLPDYEKNLLKIDKLEQRLKLQQEKINKMDEKLDKEKEMNEKKMRKVFQEKQKHNQ